MKKKWGMIFAVIIFVLILLFINIPLLSHSQSPNKKSIVIQTFKNQELRSFHTTKRIDKKLSAQLEDSLLTIDGVTEVRAGKDTDKYEIKIRKGLVFKWEEIEPVILNCIAMLCYSGQQPAIRRVDAKY